MNKYVDKHYDVKKLKTEETNDDWLSLVVYIDSKQYGKYLNDLTQII